MSTVRQFISATSVWHELTPALERVTRYCNLHSIGYTRPILRLGAVGNASLVAEIAFRLAAVGQRDIDDGDVSDAIAAAALFLGRQVVDRSHVNLQEVEALRQNLLLYFDPPEAYDFFPSIPGVGVIDESDADVRQGPTLYEVKTVTRGWHSSDLRQCLTYTAMLYSIGESISKVSLVNPRTGRFTELSVAQVAVGAGADSAPGLLSGLLYRMVGLDVSV